MKDGHKKSPRTMAERADRHKLYEKSVQDVEAEYNFVTKTFRDLRGRKPASLREDFCGTAGMCCEWVSRRGKNTAVGVDIDTDVLAWGRENNLAKLKPEEQMRVQLLQEDVCTVTTPEPVDMILAMNFSYQIFKTREKLGGYFRHVREGLVDDGLFILDVFGGYESFKELREKRKYKGFKYIWEHASYNPINGDIVCHIHFTFPDGSKLKKAFTYEWRMWTLPELQELLHEAGFAKVTVYWEELDDEGDGSGEYSPATVGDADPGWVCFIVAEK
jgi:cyclopropane fatty-acyl-phospholipid synthase-like methyltransferase